MIIYYFICIGSTLRAVRSKVRIPIGITDFYLLQNFQTGSGYHRSSYLMETGALQRAEMLPRCAFSYSPPFGAVVKNERSYNSTSPICLHGADRRNFTFLTFFYKNLISCYWRFSFPVLMKFWVSTCNNII
jgi:hypothetical protein